MSKESEEHRLAPVEELEAGEENQEDQAAGTGSAETGAGQGPPELASLRAAAEEHRERSLRLAAELENVRRRTSKQLDTTRRYAVEQFAIELLPVADSLELALESAKGAPATLREGLELTLKLLREVFARHHIEAVAPQRGEPFDPQWHEAMATQPTAEVRADAVLTLVQKGYRLQNRLLRPARVIVARGQDVGA